MKAQEGHEGEVKAQEEQGEDANSLHEESHVSDRHMMWWRNAWWIRIDSGPHLRTARDRRRAWRAATRAAREARETRKASEGRKGEMGDGKQRKQRKQYVAHRIAPTPTATATSTTAAAATAAASAAMRLQ